MFICKNAMDGFLKLMGCAFLVSMLSACTGYNSLYPKYSSYQGDDSAILFVMDDSYNQSIYTYELTKEGCFDQKQRRLLTRNLALKGTGKDIYQYKIKADQYYIIGVQSPGYFHYRTFIPKLNKIYGIYSGYVIELSATKDINNVTPEDFYTTKVEPSQINSWNIKNVCPGLFGSKTIG